MGDTVRSALCCKIWCEVGTDLDECGKILCKVGMPLQPLLTSCGDVLRQLHSLDPTMLHLKVSRSSIETYESFACHCSCCWRSAVLSSIISR